MPREISLASLSALTLDPSEAIELAAATGFTSVGLRTGPAGGVDHRLLGDSPARRAAKSALTRTGLTVLDGEILMIQPPGVPSPDPGPILEATADLGCRNMAVISFDPDQRRGTDALARLGLLAQGYEIALSLEFMSFTTVRSLHQALDVIATIDLPNCGVLLDCLHFFRTGGTVADLAAIPDGRLRFVQFCDASPGGVQSDPQIAWTEARTGRLPPGEGEFPLVDVLAALASTLPLSVEVPLRPDADPAEHADVLLACTRRVLAAAGAG